MTNVTLFSGWKLHSPRACHKYRSGKQSGVAVSGINSLNALPKLHMV